ncbi:hypothetical protein [Clostridium cellulovorans]|uniref:Cell division membrane protein n=1 Tax=Clostridium cellulovorans (strain ATCC 35296 / DSM 3052 / OCM 3 / 743B) TaxID=573061 RepID=D9SSI8_CLOC7|nr:hypothetical protein [Clostridium cellulovorans]ADL50585.1 cell division membrane protein [Clostridium cellulovorans 743B]
MKKTWVVFAIFSVISIITSIYYFVSNLKVRGCIFIFIALGLISISLAFNKLGSN